VGCFWLGFLLDKLTNYDGRLVEGSYYDHEYVLKTSNKLTTRSQSIGNMNPSSIFCLVVYVFLEGEHLIFVCTWIRFSVFSPKIIHQCCNQEGRGKYLDDGLWGKRGCFGSYRLIESKEVDCFQM